MKNLKKILIVIAMLALLVSSVVVVIGAADETEPHTVDALADLIESVDTEVLVKGETADIAKQATKIADVFEYITAYEWKGDETGKYDEYKLPLVDEDGNGQSDKETKTITISDAIEKANKYAVEIGERLHGLVETQVGTGDAKLENQIKAINAVKAHIDVCYETAKDATGFAELIAKAEATNVGLVQQYYNKYNASKPLDSTAYIEKAFIQLAKYPINEVDNEALITSLSLAACSQAELMLENYNKLYESFSELTEPELVHGAAYLQSAYLATYTKVTNEILLLEKFLQNVDASKGEKYNEVMAGFLAALAKRDALVESKKVALDAQANFDSYDLAVISNKTYDGNKTAEELGKLSADQLKEYNAANELYQGINSAGDHRTQKEFEEFSVSGKKVNGYQTFIYGDSTSPPHLYWYTPVTNAEEYGIVFEWDMRVNGTAKTISVQDVDNTGSPWLFEPMVYFQKSEDGTGYNVTNGYSTYNTENPVAPITSGKVFYLDVWTHFTITYDAESRLGKLYINYQYIMDIDYFHEGGGILSQIRFGPSNERSWKWEMDNVKIYRGSQFRITDKFEKMSEEERFNYFVEYANSSENPYLSRNLAYKKAEALVASVQNKAACAKAVAMMTNPEDEDYINYTSDIKIPAMADNLDLLKEHIAELEAIPIDSANVAKLRKVIAEINEFVSVNAELINKGDTSEGGYQEQIAKVYAIEADIEKIDNIVAFVEAIEKFERATTHVALSRHAATAKQIYDIAKYEIAENREDVAKDPVVLAFEEKYNNTGEDGKLLTPKDEGYLAPGSEGYVTLFEYYDQFASEIGARLEHENSKRIVNSIAYITAKEGYEATVEYWAANAEDIIGYVSLIRGIVKDGAYDETYEGVDEAVDAYWAMEVYFYEVLQKEHVAYLEELIGRYTNTDSYIEKSSIVSAALSYFATKDIALDNVVMTNDVAVAVADEMKALSDLKIILGVYEYELYGDPDDDEDGYISSFEDVLEQQTQYFINIINHMDSVINYAELEALFEQASAYYYGINVTVEGAAEAAEKYAAYRTQLATIRENNAMFIAYANNVKNAAMYNGNAKRDAIYAALKDCSAYINVIDENNADVAAAIAIYNAQVAEYNAKVAKFNGAMFESVCITNAVRCGRISASVLAVVGNIINN